MYFKFRLYFYLSTRRSSREGPRFRNGPVMTPPPIPPLSSRTRRAPGADDFPPRRQHFPKFPNGHVRHSPGIMEDHKNGNLPTGFPEIKDSPELFVCLVVSTSFPNCLSKFWLAAERESGFPLPAARREFYSGV